MVLKAIKVILVTFSMSLFAISLQASNSDDTRFAVSPIVGVQAQGDHLMVTTQFPNTCYDSSTSFKQLQGEGKLALFHFASVETQEACLRVVNYHQFEIPINNLADQTYTLVDGYDGEPFATLTIDDGQPIIEE